MKQSMIYHLYSFTGRCSRSCLVKTADTIVPADMLAVRSNWNLCFNQEVRLWLSNVTFETYNEPHDPGPALPQSADYVSVCWCGHWETDTRTHTHSCLKMASWELKCSGWHRAKASICFQSHRGNVEPGRALNWFRSEKVGCHTFAHWCLLFPYVQNQTAWQGNPLWAKHTHVILFCSFKVQTRGPLCYRCTVVKNHGIALLLSAQDSTAGLCEQLHRIIQCTSVPQRHKLGTVLHLYDPNKHGLHSEGSPLSYIIRRRPELVSCSTYCWHFNQLILIKQHIEHRNRFHTNAAIFTRWMNNSENLHRKIIQRWDKETWEPFMFNVKYELPLWEEIEKEDFTACLTSVTGDANSGC